MLGSTTRMAPGDLGALMIAGAAGGAVDPVDPLGPVEIGALVEAFVRDRSRVGVDDARFSRSSNLWEDGYVDSIGVVELIGFIEATFGVELPDEALFHPDFTSIDGIARIVSALPARAAE